MPPIIEGSLLCNAYCDSEDPFLISLKKAPDIKICWRPQSNPYHFLLSKFVAQYYILSHIYSHIRCFCHINKFLISIHFIIPHFVDVKRLPINGMRLRSPLSSVRRKPHGPQVLEIYKKEP